MNIPIKPKNQVALPPNGYAFPFIDAEDYQLKAKLSDGIVINYSSVSEQTKMLSLTDYTAFQVYAHSEAITAGQTSDALGGMVNYEIPASLTHEFRIRTNGCLQENSDVIIDWGDGEINTIKEGGDFITKTSGTFPDLDYFVTHTYATTGKYIIKVYGKQYYNICGVNGTGITGATNLMCRCFDWDLPIASHITDLASFCVWAIRLLNVNASDYRFKGIINISNLFYNCKNLLVAKGFKNQFLMINAYDKAFANCYSLASTDFTIPAYCSRNSTYEVFCDNLHLNMDISKLFPQCGLLGTQFTVGEFFRNCKLLYGTVLSEKLWNHPTIVWKNTSKAFLGCSDDIRSQVPTSWGGTKSVENNG